MNQASLFDAAAVAVPVQVSAAQALDPAAWRDVPAPPGAPAVAYRVRLRPKAAEWWCEKLGEWREVGNGCGLVDRLVGAAEAAEESK